MKISKKLTIAGIIITVIFGATFVYSIIPQKTDLNTATAVLVYNTAEKNISEQLSNEEALIIYNIFNGKKLVDTAPASRFTSNVSVRFGEDVFCISGEGSLTVKLQNKGKYFNISAADRKEIEAIFEKYGGVFPFVF